MPAGATYEPLATTTLAVANSDITFSSIPGTYTDLRVVFQGVANSGTMQAYMRLNGNTGSNYSYTILEGNGTTAASSRVTNDTAMYLSYESLNTTAPGLAIIDIFSYAGSTNKTVLIQHSVDKNGSGRVARSVQLFRSTSAITTVLITGLGTNFGVGTTATLYGIKAA